MMIRLLNIFSIFLCLFERKVTNVKVEHLFICKHFMKKKHYIVLWDSFTDLAV